MPVVCPRLELAPEIAGREKPSVHLARRGMIVLLCLVVGWLPRLGKVSCREGREMAKIGLHSGRVAGNSRDESLVC